MALRTSTVLLCGAGIAGIAGAAPGEAVCPLSTSPYMGTVTSFSPACFQQCPLVCDSLDAAINEYMKTMSADSVKAKMCAAPESFSCLFEEANYPECKKVLEAGQQFQIALPTSQAELDEQCGVGKFGDDSSLGAEAGQGDTATTSTTTTTTGAAAGSGGEAGQGDNATEAENTTTTATTTTTSGGDAPGETDGEAAGGDGMAAGSGGPAGQAAKEVGGAASSERNVLRGSSANHDAPGGSGGGDLVSAAAGVPGRARALLLVAVTAALWKAAV